MDITVYGSGAIGGTAGAFASIAGNNVTMVDKVSEHVIAMNEEGLRISGVQGELIANVEAMQPHDIKGELDTVFLAVKSQDTKDALEILAPHIGPQSTVVSLQNGINEPAIADAIGAEHTVGCFVNWAADYEGPGHIEYKGVGHCYVGEIDGTISRRVIRIQQVLSNTCSAYVTNNVYGYLWSKEVSGPILMCNALGVSGLGEMLAVPQYQPAYLALILEAMKVAETAGIKLEPFPGFDPFPLKTITPDDGYKLLDEWAEYRRVHEKSHSGPWRDIAVRHRPTEVDYLTGLVVQKGEELGVPTPLHRRLVALIKEVESGSRPQRDDNMLEFNDLL